MTPKTDNITCPIQTPVSTPLNLIDNFSKTSDVIQGHFN